MRLSIALGERGSHGASLASVGDVELSLRLAQSKQAREAGKRESQREGKAMRSRRLFHPDATAVPPTGLPLEPIHGSQKTGLSHFH